MLTLQPFTNSVCIYSSPPVGNTDIFMDIFLDNKFVSGPMSFIYIQIVDLAQWFLLFDTPPRLVSNPQWKWQQIADCLSHTHSVPVGVTNPRKVNEKGKLFPDGPRHRVGDYFSLKPTLVLSCSKF